jgi:anhydro-N-acetylmuramic acid kinase
LQEAAQGTASSHELAQLHHDLGRFYARHAADQSSGTRPQLVGLHGQTVFHAPGRQRPATFQLGEPAYLVEALRAPVVSNFRAADLAAGGQGAPLATMFHRWVMGRRGRHVCVNNLGGISNVTSIDWTCGDQPEVVAFDTGPANMLVDLAMRHYTQGKKLRDTNGAWAGRGTVSEILLRRWLKHPYFARQPPKSTGRELFGEPFLRRALAESQEGGLSRYDVLATLTAFTARSLALNYRLHLRSLPQQVILTGGGAANATLVKAIRSQLQQLSPSVTVLTSETLGWPLQSIEPAAFALLAYLRWRSRPGNLPQTTGAGRAALLGQVSEP